MSTNVRLRSLKWCKFFSSTKTDMFLRQPGAILTSTFLSLRGDRCVAFTYGGSEFDGGCRLAESCTHRLGISVEDAQTYVKPGDDTSLLTGDLEPGTISTHGGSELAHQSQMCRCDTYHEPCYDPALCRFGQCFRGPALPDGTPYVLRLA